MSENAWAHKTCLTKPSKREKFLQSLISCLTSFKCYQTRFNTIKYGVQTGKSLVTKQWSIAKHYPFGQGFRALKSHNCSLSLPGAIPDCGCKTPYPGAGGFFIFSWSNSLLWAKSGTDIPHSWATLGQQISQAQGTPTLNFHYVSSIALYTLYLIKMQQRLNFHLFSNTT